MPRQRGVRALGCADYCMPEARVERVTQVADEVQTRRAFGFSVVNADAVDARLLQSERKLG